MLNEPTICESAVPVACHCLDCGYALRGLTTSRCPECGRGFDPADLTTMDRTQSVTPLVRTLGRRVGWPLHVFAGLVAGVSILSASVPDGYLPLTLLAVMGGVVVVGLWLLRALIVLIINLWLRSSKMMGFSAWKHWSVMPVIFTLTFALIYFQIPLHLRFQLSVGAMTRQAQRAMAAYPASQSLPDQWIGLYNAEDIAVIQQGNGFQFLIVKSNFLDQSGFAYFPNGAPPNAGYDYYRHFRGDWYVRVQRF